MSLLYTIIITSLLFCNNFLLFTNVFSDVQTVSLEELQSTIQTQTINSTDRHGFTPLMRALEAQRDINIITFLLEMGARTTTVNNNGFSPLMIAVLANNDAAHITKLLENNADVNVIAKNKQTALMLAARFTTDIVIIKALLKISTLTIDEQDEQNFTALMYSTQYNANPKISIALIEAGADIDIQIPKTFISAMILALQYHPTDDSIFKAMIKKDAAVTLVNEQESTLLHIAARYTTSSDIIDILLQTGDVSLKDNNGLTPLAYSAYYNPTVAITKKLIAAKSDINTQDKEGKTPLIGAAQFNTNAQIITTLLEANADVHLSDNKGNTPLIFAARENPNKSVLQTLLDAGSDVNKINTNGDTALMWAALKNPNFEIIGFLLDKGADATVRNLDRARAYDFSFGNLNFKQLYQTPIYERLLLESFPQKNNDNTREKQP